MTDAVLDEAYQRLHAMGPEFGGDEEGNHGLTNHGPMAVEVMVRRGLDLDVHRWLDRYLPRLTELPAATERITAQNWRDALGDGRRVGDWTAYFLAQLAEQRWQQVLTAWWPRLLPGIAAGSTHGVIRVGHAVRAVKADDQDRAAINELGHGLAFWASRSRVLPGATTPAGTLPPSRALDALPRLAEQSGPIAHRLDRLADLAGWPTALAALRPPAEPADVPGHLIGLAQAGLRNYLTHGHASPVLLVHVATAPNAVRHILPVLPEPVWIPSFAAVWAASAAITTAYAPATPGTAPALAPALPTAPPLAAPGLAGTDTGTGTGTGTAADTLDRAARHGDEHVIKFADTAIDVFDHTGDPLVLAAARLAARLLPARTG